MGNLVLKIMLKSCRSSEPVIVFNTRGPPCDSEGLVGDFGSAVGDRELVFAEECVTFPSKDGVITETAEDGVTERQEKHLQHKQETMTTMKRKDKISAYLKFTGHVVLRAQNRQIS